MNSSVIFLIFIRISNHTNITLCTNSSQPRDGLQLLSLLTLPSSVMKVRYVYNLNNVFMQVNLSDLPHCHWFITQGYIQSYVATQVYILSTLKTAIGWIRAITSIWNLIGHSRTGQERNRKRMQACQVCTYQRSFAPYPLRCDGNKSKPLLLDTLL